MRVAIWFLAAAISTSSAARSKAQDEVSTKLADAFLMNKKNRPRAVIALLEPLVRSGASPLDSDDAGKTWVLLGSSYQELERYDDAIRSYNSAIRCMKTASTPSERAEYAGVLVDLASAESSLGQFAESEVLGEKGLELYASLGRHDGVATAATDLALTTMLENNFGSARRFLARANQEAQLSSLRADDQAAISKIEGVLEEHDGQLNEAIVSFEHAIRVQTKEHGPDDYALAASYCLRGHAEAETGDFAAATADAQHGLTIIAASIGTNTPSYWRAELALAKILRSSGKKTEANQLERQASSSLASLMRSECRRCTIPVESLR